MTTKNFTVKNGLTTGNIVLDAASSNATVGNLIGPHANGNSNVNIPTANGNINLTAGGNVTLVVTSTGANVAGTLNTGTGNITSGNANLGNLVIANYHQGTLTTAAQPNITSVGTLTSLTVTGNISMSAGQILQWNSDAGISRSSAAVLSIGNGTNNDSSGTLNLARLLATANVTAPQIISNVSTGTAPLVVTSTTLVSNLNANALQGSAPATANTASTISLRDANGNISANYFIGNGSQLTGLSTSSLANGNSNVNIPTANGNINLTAGGNVTLVVTSTGANVAGYANITGALTVGANITSGSGTGGNITGANLVSANYFTGTLTTAAQPNITSVGTLTSLTVNGLITALTSATTTGTTITPTAGSTNQYNVTALASAATIATPSGTPVDGQKLTLRFKDNGTARALTWTTTSGAYRAVGVTLPATTVISKVLYVGCIYNSQDTFWDVVAVGQQ